MIRLAECLQIKQIHSFVELRYRYR